MRVGVLARRVEYVVRERCGGRDTKDTVGGGEDGGVAVRAGRARVERGDWAVGDEDLGVDGHNGL